MLCPLAKQSRFVPGRGNKAADLMIVGEAPGQQEELRGKPFIGASGRRLSALLAEVGISEDDVYITNVEKYRPPRNRNPHVAEILACERHLLLELKRVQPRVVLAMGGVAAKWFIPDVSLLMEHGYPRDVTIQRDFRQLRLGRKLKVSEYGREERPRRKGKIRRGEAWTQPGLPVTWTGTVIPTFHPAYTLRNPNLWPIWVEDVVRLEERLTTPPLSNPNYRLITNEEVLEYVHSTARV